MTRKQTAPPPGSAPKPRRRKGRARGTLAAVGSLLVASALLRTAIGAGEALAREDPAPGPGMQAATAQDPAPMARQHAAAAPPGGAPILAEADLMPLLDSLRAREARIRKRESEIDIRMQALSVAEQEIDRKLAALEEAEKALRATLALAQTAAEDDLARLTDVYANMKPKQAAALFEQMDPEFAAGFLGRMRPNVAAAIMAGMKPETAYLVSVIVAGRNAEVPKE
ncbi:MotE family protein [Ponticoccus sp. (in: a-proteobacteria)]|uniref:MotE family protein n=1 Tax=Ponticoccus sp. (in: a-proteobacteria) TaxID=1925025 RepID=UPI003AB4667C